MSLYWPIRSPGWIAWCGAPQFTLRIAIGPLPSTIDAVIHRQAAAAEAAGAAAAAAAPPAMFGLRDVWNRSFCATSTYCDGVTGRRLRDGRQRRHGRRRHMRMRAAAASRALAAFHCLRNWTPA